MHANASTVNLELHVTTVNEDRGVEPLEGDTATTLGNSNTVDGLLAISKEQAPRQRSRRIDSQAR